MKDRYTKVKDGLWANARGDTIRRVVPKGLPLYAKRTVGSRRPEWYDSLKEAKAAKNGTAREVGRGSSACHGVLR